MKAILITLLILISCGKETKKKSSTVQQNVSPTYQSSKIQVRVYYETGAEPYTDQVLGLELWSILEQNLNALLQGRSIQVVVPKALNEMTNVNNAFKANWTSEEIIALSEKHPVTATTNSSDFQIFFLNGTFKENSSIIGLHFGGTKVMAIFKDVIRASGTGQLGFIPRYVEQATIVHEMGHALGLVNNGVPMVTGHQDASHGAHCSNQNCVMYYQNEGVQSLIKFAKNVQSSGSTIMFDQHCLDDAKNYQK